MKILNIQVKNFRSLRNISMEDIADLAVIIGQNSSGKSNLLEALDLFFNHFDPAPQRNVGAVNDYLWFDRNPQNEIIFTLKIGFTASELRDILPEQLNDILGETNEVDVTRVLSGTLAAASWSTRLLVINGTKVVSDGKLVYKNDQITDVKEAQTLPSGAPFVPSVPIPPPVISLVASVPPPLPPPSQPTIQPPSVSPTDVLGRLLQKFSQRFMGRYRIISAARNVVGPPARLGDRVPFVNQAALGDLTTLGQSMEAEHQKKWTDVEERVTTAARNVKDLRVLSGQITVGEEGSAIRYPISLVGGSNQEILSILRELTKEENMIYGLEEPEQHLHPELARDLFNVLKDISKESQIFVTTHSPIFVDQADFGGTWLARKVENETQLTRVRETPDLREVLYEIGVKASDIFFANAILFVEGETERVVVPILAKKLGIDFRQMGLSIIPIHGKGSGKYHLETWIEASKAANIPYFMLLDADAKNEATRLMSSNLLKDNYNLFLLQNGSIEDYYPDQRTVEALKSKFGIEVTKEEAKELLKFPRAKSIKQFLTDKKVDTRGWKVVLGGFIASASKVDEFDEEIRRFLERLRSEVEKSH